VKVSNFVQSKFIFHFLIEAVIFLSLYYFCVSLVTITTKFITTKFIKHPVNFAKTKSCNRQNQKYSSRKTSKEICLGERITLLLDGTMFQEKI